MTFYHLIFLRLESQGIQITDACLTLGNTMCRRYASRLWSTNQMCGDDPVLSAALTLPISSHICTATVQHASIRLSSPSKLSNVCMLHPVSFSPMDPQPIINMHRPVDKRGKNLLLHRNPLLSSCATIFPCLSVLFVSLSYDFSLPSSSECLSPSIRPTRRWPCIHWQNLLRE